MGGFKGRKMRFHMDKEDVIAIIQECFPTDAHLMAQVFLERTEQHQADLEGMIEASSKKEAEEEHCSEELESGDGLSFLTMQCDRLDQLSTVQLKLLTWISSSAGQIRKQIIEENPAQLNRTSDELKDVIFERSIGLNLKLVEGSWQWIEEDADLEQLKLLLILLLVDSRDLAFCNIRRAIFESAKLCKIVLEMSMKG
jgi:hypothetical protein